MTPAEPHPHKILARQAVASALRLGLMRRQPCGDCARDPEEKLKGRRIVQFHHPDYTPGRFLKGRWRCGPGGCHAEADRKDGTRKGK